MRRSAIVLGAWLLLLVAALPFALRQSDGLSAAGFEVPGSQSERVERELAGIPPDFRPTALAGLLASDGPARRGDYEAALDALERAAAATPGVRLDPLARGIGLQAALERPGRPALVPLTVSVDEFEAPDTAGELRDRLGLDERRRYGAVSLHLVGQGALWAALHEVTRRDLREGEALGFPVVLLLLLAAFGSLAAAALPAAVGAAAVVVTGAAIHWLSSVTLMSVYSTTMAAMIGLGVAVDYALFVVVRYREELRSGAAPPAARRAAMATSGVAVLVSGAALLVALAGLLVVDTPAIRSLALGSMVVVAVAMLACSTLLPALLDLLGRRLGAPAPRGPGAAARLAAAALARPRTALAAALALLALLAAPALWLHTGAGALRQLPEGHEARAGFDAAGRVVGEGRGSPLKLVVPPAAAERAVAVVRADREVARTALRTQTRDGSLVLAIATPRHGGDTPEAKDLVRRLRAGLPRGSLVGGDAAAQVDFDDEVARALPALVAWIAALSVALLVLALRSLPIAIGAVLTNLVSVAAAFGVLTAVFGWGEPGYVDTIVVPVVLAVVFGLSMDYQVFLLSRIRERWLATGDTRRAVAEGTASSARTITSAAAIMVAVFLAFVATGVPAVKEIGLGAAVAIAVDATIVRLMLVPAALLLVGERAWWLPRLGWRSPMSAQAQTVRDPVDGSPDNRRRPHASRQAD